jgi:hypothetical protein
LKAIRANGGRCEYRRPTISAAASVRAAGEDFSASFSELRELVGKACAGQSEWEARIVAGIKAVVEFAVENPAKARAVTVEARRADAGSGVPEQSVLEYFTERLADAAPAEKRLPISADRSIVEAIAVIVRGHLLAGTSDQLPESVPDFVYLALRPYLGLAETRAWARAVSLGT